MKCVGMSTVDLRSEPKFRSERSSQLIFGEEVEIIGEEGEYCRVIGVDLVKGYVMKNLIVDSSKKIYKLRKNHRSGNMVLPFGSYVNEDDATEHNIPENLLVKISKNFNPWELAKEFMGVPYLWGGTSDLGYDCSGFTQRLFRFSNTEIPRNSGWQREASKTVESFNEAQAGDLVFYHGHVTFYIGNMTIIHSNVHNGGVSYTQLNDNSEYSKSLDGSFEKIGRLEIGKKYDLPFKKDSD